MLAKLFLKIAIFNEQLQLEEIRYEDHVHCHFEDDLHLWHEFGLMCRQLTLVLIPPGEAVLQLLATTTLDHPFRQCVIFATLWRREEKLLEGQVKETEVLDEDIDLRLRDSFLVLFAHYDPLAYSRLVDCERFLHDVDEEIPHVIGNGLRAEVKL